MISPSHKSSIRCDVVVAGAGPAGASAAAHLARTGLRVIVVDQKQFPRDKVCGDFVSPVALNELDSLGVSGSRVFRSTNVIRAAALFLNGKRLVGRSIPRSARFVAYGRVIPRQTLDRLILAEARRRGARYLAQHRVTAYAAREDRIDVFMQTPNGNQCIQAAVLIGADGSTSVVARQLRRRPHPKRHLIVALRAYFSGVRGPSDRADLYFSAQTFPGYFWIFPTGPRTANVGVGVLAETVPDTPDRLRELLVRMIETDPGIRRRLDGARMVGKIVGWPLSTYDATLPLAADRLLLAGDAAGMINPLNGEGIQYALLSGRWAATAAFHAIRSGDLSRGRMSLYERQAREQLRADMALSAFIVEWIRNRRLNPVWLAALRVIASRSGYDSIYGATVGGILAGVVPASAATSAQVILGTVEETAAWLGAATGAFAGSGPTAWLAAMRSLVQFLDHAFQKAHLGDVYAPWARHALTATRELALSAAGARRVPAQLS